MVLIELCLLLVAVAAVLAAGPALAGLSARDGFRELRRLWRKEVAGTGGPVAGLAAPLALACATGAVVLVPAASLDVSFADLPAALGLLAAGRLVSALAAVEAGGVRGGTDASRTALFLLAAGPGAALAVLVVSGLGGLPGLAPALAAVRDAVPLPSQLPLVLAAGALAVLGQADRACAAPEVFAGGRTLLLFRLAEAVRLVAWLDLVAGMLPPLPPTSLVAGLGVWAVKLAVLLVLSEWLGRRLALRPVAAPALAGLLGLGGALLLALRGVSA